MTHEIHDFYIFTCFLLTTDGRIIEYQVITCVCCFKSETFEYPGLHKEGQYLEMIYGVVTIKSTEIVKCQMSSK